MKYYLVFNLTVLSQLAFPQVHEINPTTIEYLELSTEGEKEFNRNIEIYWKVLDKMPNGINEEELTKEEQYALSIVDETMTDYWGIIGEGCSWYCAGGPKEVTASSHLKLQGKNSYEPGNAHDLNYKHAWVEGVPGYGIGEYLIYTFSAASPRVNEIIVVNGYVKSQSAWENNSRVKKLKVYLNDKPYVILNLEDVRAAQHFNVEPIGESNRKNWDELNEQPDWTLKFEIIEVYKGLKYDDVVISEIYFNGLDVHCFAKGTKIMMADKSIKNIEDLKLGDNVAYLDLETNKLKAAKIEKLENVVHNHLVSYKFESGREITATQDHPFRLQNKDCWASLKPEKSKQYKGFENIEKVQTGDLFLTPRGTEKLIGVEILEEEQETYTISKLSAGNNFIANGLVVGVEELTD